MKNGYLSFSPEELAENQDFIGWVLHSRNQDEWEEFLRLNKHFEPTVRRARRIVELLQVREERMDELEVIDMWQNIERFEQQKLKRPARMRKLNLMRYAAILIFVFLLCGTAGYLITRQSESNYVFTQVPDSTAKSAVGSRLVLADGTSIDLRDENATIELKEGEQVIINDEEVIDLAKKTDFDGSRMNEVFVPFGRKIRLMLEDGTAVWLNAGSRMAFPTKFSGKKREVFVEGEAYFEVAENKKMPFVVNAEELAIKVLGTKFNVSAYKADRELQTTLLEGKVSLHKKHGVSEKDAVLLPNQKATYNKSLQSMSIENDPEAEISIAWTKGRFDFSQESFDVVLKKLERYYNVSFQYETGFVTSHRITGKLDLKDSIEQVMSVLSDVANMQYQIKGNNITLKSK